MRRRSEEWRRNSERFLHCGRNDRKGAVFLIMLLLRVMIDRLLGFVEVNRPYLKEVNK